MPRGTELVVGARTFTLRYRTEAMTLAESRLNGESWEDAIGQGKRGFNRLLTYLWVGLRGQNRGGKGGAFTLEETRELMDGALDQGLTYNDLWERILTAFVDSGLIPAPPVPPEESPNGAAAAVVHDTQRPTLVPALGHSDMPPAG